MGRKKIADIESLLMWEEVDGLKPWGRRRPTLRQVGLAIVMLIATFWMSRLLFQANRWPVAITTDMFGSDGSAFGTLRQKSAQKTDWMLRGMFFLACILSF